MLKRLRGILFGKPPGMVAAQDLSFYPMVGASTPATPGDTTVFWSGEAPAGTDLDRTVLAPAPDVPVAPARLEPAVERPRLAWPARDASRIGGEAPPPAAEPRPAMSARPADDVTVLVARRSRPHQPSA